MSYKSEIFAEFGINNSHSMWQTQSDNWYCIEIIKEMTGGLAQPDTDEVQVMIDFLRDKPRHLRLIQERGIEFGSMYLSAKRFIFRFIEDK